MRVLKIISLVLVFSLSVSCFQGAKTVNKEVPQLLKAVSSDALVVKYSDTCEELLAQIDSNNIFHKLHYSSLSKAPAVYSLTYLGSLASSLAIEVQCTQEQINAFIGEAKRLDLCAKSFKISNTQVVILTTHDAALSEISRHISEKCSILDAPSFEQAANAAAGGGFAIYRCRNSKRYIPKNFLEGIFPRKVLTKFAEKFADWIVLRKDGEISIIHRTNEWGFADMIESLPCGKSKLGTILPEEYEFALSMPIDIQKFREAFGKLKDASVQRNSYNSKLNALKKSSGKDPLNWELELGIKELGLLRMESSNIVLLRTEKEDFECRPNLYRGFLPILYGSGFTPSDDSHIASFAGWTIIGSEADIQKFIENCNIDTRQSRWPNKDTHFIIDYSGQTLDWSKKEIRIWNSSQ